MSKIHHFFIFFLFTCMAFSTHLGLPLNIAKLFSSLKMLSLLGVLFSLGAYFIFYIKQLNITLFLLSLMFPFYYALLCIFWKDEYSINTVIMYFLWSIYVFMLAYKSFHHKKLFIEFINTCFFTTLFILILSFLLYLMPDTPSGGIVGRFSLGFENPNYMSQFCQIIITTGVIRLYLLEHKPIYKYLTILVFILCFYLLLIAQSRNVLLGIIVFLFIFLTYFWKTKIVIKASALITIILLIISISPEKINSMSSGRIALWDKYISESYDQVRLSMLYGPQTTPSIGDMVPTYSRLGSASENKGVNKFHADNMYIELFVEGGTIGIFLFILPYLYLLKYKLQCDTLYRRIWISISFCILIQAIFITNFTSFFAPISLFYGGILLIIRTPKKTVSI